MFSHYSSASKAAGYLPNPLSRWKKRVVKHQVYGALMTGTVDAGMVRIQTNACHDAGECRMGAFFLSYFSNFGADGQITLNRAEDCRMHRVQLVWSARIYDVMIIHTRLPVVQLDSTPQRVEISHLKSDCVT